MGGTALRRFLLEHDKSLGFAGHDRVFPEGYAQITDRLAEGADILLGHEVTQIDYWAHAWTC